MCSWSFFICVIWETYIVRKCKSYLAQCIKKCQCALALMEGSNNQSENLTSVQLRSAESGVWLHGIHLLVWEKCFREVKALQMLENSAISPPGINVCDKVLFDYNLMSEAHFHCTGVSPCSPWENEECCWKCSASDVPEVSTVQRAVWGEFGEYTITHQTWNYFLVRWNICLQKLDFMTEC